MKTNLRFLAVAAAIFSVLSCTREIENIDREEASQTLHYVHFIADAPETKTNLGISQDGAVSYSWTASDECSWKPVDGDCRWTITNKTKGETAQEITAALTDGVLALTAGFSSEVTAGDVLFAQYNKSVSSTQNYVSESKYHQESDVMISNEIVVQDGDNSNTDYYFSFKRRVAFAKMTLKEMNPNDYVSKVTIKSNKAIAGTYNSETDSFDSNSSNSIVLNDILEKIDENGTATIYFAVVPVEDANLTVTVETVTEEAAVANTYRKTFARPISFVTGDVSAFGVAMTKLVDSEGGWVKTDISAISASDIVVIVGSNYGIRNDEGTSTSPDVVSVTISNNKITSVVPNNIKWNISGNSTDGYVFYPNGNSDKWLYCNTTKSSKNNDNIRVGTGDRKQWKPDVNGYYVNTVGGTKTYVQRVLSIYNNSDWRSYNNTDNNPQKLEFYVLQSAGSSEGGGENPGVTTVSLDKTEIQALGKIAYTNLKTINDGEVTWTVYAYKEAATRPYLQLKKDSGVYVKISAPSAIKEVRLTITSTTNSKGGAEDISQHSAYSSSETISLKSADAAGDATKNDVVSCTGNAISNNNVTLVPDGAYTDLYLKVSAGARIWGIEVDY